jgi:predicted nicotinamide N-methyase
MAAMRIAGFEATLTDVVVDEARVALWQVDRLERHVDRDALLASEDPPEPPYWAHLWSGAVVLARALPRTRGPTLEIGCGLGLPGLVAAGHGAPVVFVDRVPAALAFVRASAEANRLRGVRLVAADATTPGLRGAFELVLAAELLYDRAALPALARGLGSVLAGDGRALIADAGRTDTGAFYATLDALGLRWQACEEVVREDRIPVTVRIVEVVHDGTPFAVVGS